VRLGGEVCLDPGRQSQEPGRSIVAMLGISAATVFAWSTRSRNLAAQASSAVDVDRQHFENA
jgi:hypothetical protein